MRSSLPGTIILLAIGLDGVDRRGDRASGFELRCCSGSTSMPVQGPLEVVLLTECLDGRFEKEFEGVQDVFELQVRPDTAEIRMKMVPETLCDVDQLHSPIPLPARSTPLGTSTNLMAFIAQLEQLLRLRSRPLR